MELIISSAVAIAISLGYTKFKCSRDFQSHITTHKILIDRLNEQVERMDRSERELPMKVTEVMQPFAHEIRKLKETVGV